MLLDSIGNSSHFMYNLTFALQQYRTGLLVSALIYKEIRNHPIFSRRNTTSKQNNDFPWEWRCIINATSEPEEIGESRVTTKIYLPRGETTGDRDTNRNDWMVILMNCWRLSVRIRNSWGLLSWKDFTISCYFSFSPGTTSGSHNENLSMIPLWFRQGRGNNNYCKICPEYTP